MYFIVYIIQSRQHVVVPYSWIRLNSHMENLINNGINSGLAFTVFYTNNPDAYHNGVPRADYEPNVLATSVSQFPNEGWYTCYIRKFKCKY